jgi:hypothetical protein
MRVITGKGEEIREYIKTISDKDDVIIFPENGLDLEEQSLFIENKLGEGFNGDIITFSTYIVSDAPTGSVYNINLEKKKFKLEKNHNHRFGNSADLTTTVVMGKYQSCSNLAIKELEKIRKDVYDGVDNQELMVKLAQLGDSFEKMNVISVLRKREKTLENIIGQYNESQNPQQDITQKEKIIETTNEESLSKSKSRRDK